MHKLFDSQLYEFVRIEPHTRRDGTETTLRVWRSHCVHCGEPFEVRTPARSKHFSPSRRCQKHKRPGARARAAADAA
jgi:hypothetical protein